MKSDLNRNERSTSHFVKIKHIPEKVGYESYFGELNYILKSVVELAI